MMPMHSGGMTPMAYYNTGYTGPSSPNISTANNQSFDFPGVTIPPRLKNIGRKLSQMSNDFLPPGTGNNTPEEEETKELAIQRKLSHEMAEVPGMGDEPIMCPFCNKPLPPSLLASQLTSGTGEHAHRPPASEQPTRPSTAAGTGSGSSRAGTPSRGEASSSSPAPTPGSSSSQAPSKSLLSPLPVTTPQKPQVLTATSESLAGTVREGDVANHTAAEGIVTDEELKRWSTLSGIPIPSLPPTVANPGPIPAPALQKAFPLLPPPPAPAAKLARPALPPSIDSHASSSKGFGFFGKASKDGDIEEDEDSDAEGSATGGYSRLTGPASPSDDEDEQAIVIKGKQPKDAAEKVIAKEDKPTQDVTVNRKKEKEEPQGEDGDKVEAVSSVFADARQEEKAENKEGAVQLKDAGNDEVKKVLQEVLGRVNEMSQSHAALLASHSTLLTSLKIARSNLAMAEANSEMLEDQLKRAAAPAPAGRSTAPRNVSGSTPSPATPNPPLRSSSHGTPRVTTEHVRSVTTTNPTATPATVASRTPVRVSLDDAKPRPTSLYIPSGSSAASQNVSTSDSSKSWGFWNGGKKKLPGGLGHVTVPSPAQVMAALDASRPNTPLTERKSLDFQTMVNATPSSQPSSIPEAGLLPVARTQTQTGVSRSLGGQPTLSRSMSTTNVPSRAVSSGNQSAPKAYVPTQELVKLRQAYSAAVAKMDTMSKELQELKTGKVEMEAELENLSQALFEEANKMVADERRKRAEAEENLKEVKEEREALRQTIKVLGGKVDDLDLKTVEKDAEEESGKEEETTAESSIVPRDLDKHYEALSKAIHHVGDGAEDDVETSPLAELPALSASYIDRIGIPAPTPRNVPIGFAMSSISREPEEIGREGEKPSLSVSLPAESNPWAMSSPDPPQIAMTAATPSPRPRDQLKLDQVTPRQDKVVAGEDEAHTGLGLNLDMSPGGGRT
ncbi:hypothetical protein IAR55_000948 [Kwoniella newhampshirensis]|uniref:GDP/GTP exchange factor Sec2 N-terminal domain-containing protein n=1 Tax=Kwoniella newhampshirensis TaxID=1651941 RepID=A0AAW0Z4A2_9TREE